MKFFFSRRAFSSKQTRQRTKKRTTKFLVDDAFSSAERISSDARKQHFSTLKLFFVTKRNQQKRHRTFNDRNFLSFSNFKIGFSGLFDEPQIESFFFLFRRTKSNVFADFSFELDRKRFSSWNFRLKFYRKEKPFTSRSAEISSFVLLFFLSRLKSFVNLTFQRSPEKIETNRENSDLCFDPSVVNR